MPPSTTRDSSSDATRLAALLGELNSRASTRWIADAGISNEAGTCCTTIGRSKLSLSWANGEMSILLSTDAGPFLKRRLHTADEGTGAAKAIVARLVSLRQPGLESIRVSKPAVPGTAAVFARRSLARLGGLALIAAGAGLLALGSVRGLVAPPTPSAGYAGSSNAIMGLELPAPTYVPSRRLRAVPSDPERPRPTSEKEGVREAVRQGPTIVPTAPATSRQPRVVQHSRRLTIVMQPARPRQDPNNSQPAPPVAPRTILVVPLIVPSFGPVEYPTPIAPPTPSATN